MKRSLPFNVLLVCAVCFFTVGCKPGYKMENGKWAWVSWDEAAGRRVQYLDGAIGATFHVLSDPEYAADEHHVYHRNQIIQNADPASFRRIDRSYWRDANKVFFDDSEIPGADPETFKPLSKAPWARDKKDVYAGSIALHVRDISTFTILQGVWAKDAKAYYSNSGLLVYRTVPCDYQSFVILNESYAKDRNRGYWEGVPIEGSDAASFAATGNFSAKDKFREYAGFKGQTNQ